MPVTIWPESSNKGSGLEAWRHTPQFRRVRRDAPLLRSKPITPLDVGDLSAASEEMVYAITHTGRALLLRDGQFPLSRLMYDVERPKDTPKRPRLAVLFEDQFLAARGRRGHS